MKKQHFEWRCEEHKDCRPGTEEWRQAMAAALGKKLKESNREDLVDDLDAQQLCPLCAIDLMKTENPRRSTEIQLKAAKDELRWAKQREEGYKETEGVVVDFIRNATGKSPYGGDSTARTTLGGLSGGFADRVSNLLYEAVQKRVTDILAKQGKPASKPELTKAVIHYPGDDCPWLELHDQDGQKLCQVDYDDQPNEVMEKVLQAVCGVMGIELVMK